jgi:NADH-quinone oxidoreductase subunit A
LMRPTKPRPEKNTTYECGVDPVGEGWSQTQIRYYIFAFLFVIFDVESVFLFPFATVFEKFARAGIVLTEMIVFVVILAVGLLYAWKKKVLEWL